MMFSTSSSFSTTSCTAKRGARSSPWALLLAAVLLTAAPMGTLAQSASRAAELSAIAVRTLTQTLPAKLSDHSATLLNDKIYIAGGCLGDQVSSARGESEAVARDGRRSACA